LRLFQNGPPLDLWCPTLRKEREGWDTQIPAEPHIIPRLSSNTEGHLEHYFVERVFDDAGGLGGFEAWDYIAGNALFDDGVDGDPL